MKKLILYCLSILAGINALAQDTLLVDSVNFVKANEIECPVDYFTTDQLGYIYIVNGDQLRKLNADGEKMFEQSYKNLGEITAIDATQSLRTMLFYRDLTQIVFVDNTLSVQGESIKLEKEGFTFVTLTCASFMNNHFWTYSTDDFMIKRVDKHLDVIASSANITQLTGKELSPSHLVESGDHVYLYDSLQGILQFDLFGTYVQTIPLQGIGSFQIENQTVLFIEGDYLMAYSMVDFSLARLKLPQPGVRQFRKVKNRLIFSYGDYLEIYTMEAK